MHGLGSFYLRIGDFSRALALVAVAAEAAPGDPDVAETLIRCYIAAGQAQAALDRLEVLSRRGRAGPVLDGLRSRALWVAGRHDEARRLHSALLRDAGPRRSP